MGVTQGDILEVIKTRTAEEQARDYAILEDIEGKVRRCPQHTYSSTACHDTRSHRTLTCTPHCPEPQLATQHRQLLHSPAQLVQHASWHPRSCGYKAAGCTRLTPLPVHELRVPL